jgi:uncharacterized tellurite resistance protein B-like protein
MKTITRGLEEEKQLRSQIYHALHGEIVDPVRRQVEESKHGSYFRSRMEGNSLRVEKGLMKSLYALFEDVKDKLGFREKVDLYVTGNADINAFSVLAERKGEPHIINLNSGLVELMTHDELRFVLGHELGHIINKDSELNQLIRFVYPPDDTELPPVLENKVRLWSQLCELIADRYGYMAIPDIETCVSAFFKMSSGLNIKRLDLDMHAYVKENRKNLEYFMEGDGVSLDEHPVNPIRVQALHLFAQDDTANGEMRQLVEILYKTETTEINRLKPYLVASSGLIVTNADGQATEDEIEHILSILSRFHMFPKQFLQEVADGDVQEIFESSLDRILELDPTYGEHIMGYLFELAFADRTISKDEIDVIYQIGQEYLDLSEGEISQLFAEKIQKEFVPDFRAMC